MVVWYPVDTTPLLRVNILLPHQAKPLQVLTLMHAAHKHTQMEQVGTQQGAIKGRSHREESAAEFLVLCNSVGSEQTTSESDLLY